jgi:pyridoxine/pyridoxamine 5'-phosphate oxidase
LRVWAEVIESFRATNPGVAALLTTERAYTDESGRIVVSYSKEITKIMMTPPEKMEAFCSALSLALDRAIEPRQVVFEKVEAGGTPNDAKILADELDELAGL